MVSVDPRRCYSEQIMDWTGADTRQCVHIMEEKRRQGKPFDSHLLDAMIAATAVRHGVAIVTRNKREFPLPKSSLQ